MNPAPQVYEIIDFYKDTSCTWTGANLHLCSVHEIDSSVCGRGWWTGELYLRLPRAPFSSHRAHVRWSRNLPTRILAMRRAAL